MKINELKVEVFNPPTKEQAEKKIDEINEYFKLKYGKENIWKHKKR